MKRVLITSATLLSFMTCVAQPGSGYAHDAVRDKYEKDNAGYKQKGMDWMANAMNGKTEDVYSFNTSVKMHVTTYKDGEMKDENDIQYYLSNSDKYFGMNGMQGRRGNGEDMFIIYDNKNNSMVMLNDKEKSGMAMNVNSFMSKDAQQHMGEGGEKPNIKCNKTGKTKTIQGHSCFEYVCIDADRNTKSEFWIATDIAIDISKSLRRGMFAGFSSAEGAGGLMMEASHYKSDVLQSKMEVTEINKSANLTKTIADYKMGAGMR
jgi:hypothetical protein